MWVYGYYVETKMQLSQWMGKGSSQPKKARMSWLKIKVMLVVFFDWKGNVHCQMVNKQLYQEVLARLRDAVCRKKPELWENHIWMLHHNNAPGHASLLIRSYLAKHQTSIVLHPPCSLDLAPADFFLFPNLKTTLKECYFKTTEEIQENAIRELCAMTESVFQKEFQQWKKYCEQCIAITEDYFQGDNA